MYKWLFFTVIPAKTTINILPAARDFLIRNMTEMSGELRKTAWQRNVARDCGIPFSYVQF